MCFSTVQSLQHYHLPWGVPAGGGGDGSLGACLLTGEHFVIKYNAELHIPIWAAYRLDSQVQLYGVWVCCVCCMWYVCGLCGVCSVYVYGYVWYVFWCMCIHVYTYVIMHTHTPLFVSCVVVQTSSTADPESELCFSHDPRLDLSLSSNCSGYNNTGFAKGQMVPSSESLSCPL